MTYTFGVEGAQTRLAEVATANLFVLLQDTVDLFQLCTNIGDIGGSGSDTAQISQVDFNDPMTAPAEAAAVAVTNPTVAEVTISVARQALRRDESDLHRLTALPQQMALTPALVAMDMIASISMRRTDLITALFAAIANNVGTTTVDLTVTNIQQAIFQLQGADNVGEIACVLHPQQLADLQTDLRGETGTLAFHSPTAQMLFFKAPGFIGSYLGVNFWKTSRIPTANGGADRQGAMFNAGAFAYVEASAMEVVRSQSGNFFQAIPEKSPAYIEYERTAANGLQSAVGNYYVGVAELEDLKAVTITTDA